MRVCVARMLSPFASLVHLRFNHTQHTLPTLRLPGVGPFLCTTCLSPASVPAVCRRRTTCGSAPLAAVNASDVVSDKPDPAAVVISINVSERAGSRVLVEVNVDGQQQFVTSTNSSVVPTTPALPSGVSQAVPIAAAAEEAASHAQTADTSAAAAELPEQSHRAPMSAKQPDAALNGASAAHQTALSDEQGNGRSRMTPAIRDVYSQLFKDVKGYHEKDVASVPNALLRQAEERLGYATKSIPSRAVFALHRLRETCADR